MLSRVLLGIVKRYRSLETLDERDKFIEKLLKILNSFKMYDEVEDSEIEDLVDETQLKELLNKFLCGEKSK